MRMKQLMASMIIGASTLVAMSSSIAADMTGAGATFPTTVYADTGDFGASDRLSDADLDDDDLWITNPQILNEPG